MYCRTCGNKMNDNAEICVKCGVKRNIGTEYCQVCGSNTTDKMQYCEKCGAKLMRSYTTDQMQEKVLDTGKRTFGTILLAIGFIFIFAMIANFCTSCMETNRYSSYDSISTGIRCAIFAGLFIVVGKRLRNR